MLWSVSVVSPIADYNGPIAGQHTTGGDLGATTWGPATLAHMIFTNKTPHNVPMLRS